MRLNRFSWPTKGQKCRATVGVTLKDIAKKIGKTTTTVSRALNDYDDISPETKELVRNAADELGYIPNTLARRLQKRRTDTIGLILPTFGPRFSDPFFSEFLAGVGNKAAAGGYDLLVSTRPPGEQEMQAYQSNILGRRVDGFIIVRTRADDPRINYLRKMNFPFASFGRVEGVLDFPYIDEDSANGMLRVIEYLSGLGHRRIACISPPQELMFARHRITGVKKGMDRLESQGGELLIVESDLTQRGGYLTANALLDGPFSPTAIVACNDLMALGAMSAVQDRGFIVGKDISITGFDNIPMAEHSHPPLTTVNQPIYQIGTMVCELLIQILCGEVAEKKKIMLQPSLIVRQSCGPTPG